MIRYIALVALLSAACDPVTEERGHACQVTCQPNAVRICSSYTVECYPPNQNQQDAGR